MRKMFSHNRVAEGKDEWLTPPAIIKAVGPFDLDPCAPVVRPWPTAARHLTIEDDGLKAHWPRNERVWLNPPYGTQAAKWLRKLKEHGNGVALIFARTETRVFQDYVWDSADAVIFMFNRLTFHHVDGTEAENNSGAPSALVAYGRLNAARLYTIRRRFGMYIDLAEVRRHNANPSQGDQRLF